MEQSGGDGAPIFSLENRRERRARHINTTEKKKEKKRKRKKRGKLKEQNIFVEKNQFRGCVCPETGFHIEIYRSFKRERDRQRKRE